MNLQKYQVLSTRTCPFNAQPQNQQEFYNVLCNYAMGVVGEFFEFQQALNVCSNPVSKEQINNVYKELGDIMHYAVNLLTILDVEINEELLNEVTTEDLDKALGDILEIPKKYYYHGHELEKDKMVSAIYKVISHIYFNHKYGLPEILNKNIEKLKKRYPEKFTAADSIARVDAK